MLFTDHALRRPGAKNQGVSGVDSRAFNAFKDVNRAFAVAGRFYSILVSWGRRRSWGVGVEGLVY